jgi:hypothetical protein
MDITKNFQRATQSSGHVKIFCSEEVAGLRSCKNIRGHVVANPKSCMFFEAPLPHIIQNCVFSSTAITAMYQVCALHGDSSSRYLQQRQSFLKICFFASPVKLMFGGLSPFYKIEAVCS